MSTILTGKGGDVAWATDALADVSVTAWSVEFTVDVIDVTSIDDATWRTFVAGRIDYTATVDTLATGNSPTSLAGTEAILTLGDGSVANATDLVLSKTIQTGLSISNDTTGLATATYTFVCAGAFT